MQREQHMSERVMRWLIILIAVIVVIGLSRQPAGVLRGTA